MFRACALAIALLAGGAAPAQAAVRDALECTLPRGETVRAVQSLALAGANPLYRMYAPGSARPFGLTPNYVSLASDGEEDVLVLAIPRSYDSVMASVLQRRALPACPESFGIRSYCHFADTHASLVIQADPHHADATLVSCSFSLRGRGGA
jgi:hypothetical protein